MFTSNPFASIISLWSPVVAQVYVALMILGVVGGTLLDVYHKSSGKFFALRRKKSKAAAERPLSGGETFAILMRTIGEGAVSGEFQKWPRRAAHLLTMYGFILYLITTVVMVFAYPTTATPAVLPTLWMIGALMILIGGVWFFFFLRVNVVYDGDSRFHLGRADLFVVSLVVSIVFALIWQFAQTANTNATATWIFFGIYVFFTTLLFVSVPWSKFAHMFFKPAMAFQRKIEEADGSTDLPRPSAQNYIRGS
jgi:hypothetical protein